MSIAASWSREQLRARVLAYPCTFPEGFCIAAAECMAAGAVPVTTNAFALTTTVGRAGVLIDGRPRSWFYRRRFVNAAVALLGDDQHWLRALACVPRAVRKRMVRNGRGRAVSRARHARGEQRRERPPSARAAGDLPAA